MTSRARRPPALGRIMVWDANQAIGAVQVHGQLAGPLPLGKLIEPAVEEGTFSGMRVRSERQLVRRPERLFSPSVEDFSAKCGSPWLAETHVSFRAAPLIEGFRQLITLEGFIDRAGLSRFLCTHRVNHFSVSSISKRRSTDTPISRALSCRHRQPVRGGLSFGLGVRNPQRTS